MLEVELKNVTKTYGQKVIFADLNLEIKQGEFVMLQGPSGEGKSTLLNIIGGLEKPTSGEVIIGEKNVGAMKAQERVDFYRHEVGFVFQGFYLQPQLSIRENITLPGVFAEMSKPERRERAEELAKMLGITESLDRLPAEISGGQAERACVARALFMNPKMILADEPTNNLDPDNAKKVIEILRQVWQETGATIIIASHDAVVERYAGRILKLSEGKLSEKAKQDEAK